MIKFKLDEFEGPLSLLLKLIEQEEMDITQISMAKVADQFVEYVRQNQHINPDEMADFLVVAARLLLIKSRALLPYLYSDEEEEIEEFEQQLKMYQEFLEAAKKIQILIGRKKFMFAREFNRQAILANASLAAGLETGIFSPPKNLKAVGLKNIFKDLLARFKPVEELSEEKLEHKIRIEDKILSIQQMLMKRIKFSFSKLLNQTQSKTEIIVSFLALLELSKQRELVIEQGGLFEEIIINKNN